MYFYQFPKDKLRCKRWVINSRRKDLCGLTSDEIRRKGCTLCQDHFEPSQFTNAERKRLNWYAIPTLFNVPNPPSKIDLTRSTATSRKAREPEHNYNSPGTTNKAASAESQKIAYWMHMARVNPSWKPVCTIVDKEKRKPVCVYAVLVQPSNSVGKSQDITGLQYPAFATKQSLKVRESPAKLSVSTAVSPSEDVAQFTTVGCCWESQGHVKIDGLVFNDKQSQEAVDMVRSDLTCKDGFLASDAAACAEIKTEIMTDSEPRSAVTTTDSLVPKLKVEVQADDETGLEMLVEDVETKADDETVAEMQVGDKAGGEESRQVFKALDPNGTCEPEGDLGGITVRFYHGQKVLVTRTPEIKEPVQLPSPQESEEAKHCNVGRGAGQVLPGESRTGRTQRDDRRAAGAAGAAGSPKASEFSSATMPALVLSTSCAEAGSDAAVSGTSNMQGSAAFPKPSQRRGHAPRAGVNNFIINDSCAPFKCDHCGARFALVKALTMHKKVHLSSINLSSHSGQEHTDQSDQKENEGSQKNAGESSCSHHGSDHKERSDGLGPIGNTCHAAEKTENHPVVFGLIDDADTSIIKTEGSLEMPNANKTVQTGTDELGEETHKMRSLVCKVCGAEFLSLSQLLAHRRKHSADKPFKCQECSACFGLRSSLKFHMAVHTGERLLSCTECGAGFCQEKDFRRHMSKIHGVRKMFSCQECGVTLTTSESLKNHVRIHTGEKPFKCDVCEMWFRGKSGLRAHMRLHAGNLPHVCQHCGKAFSFVSQLNKHTSMHTGQKPYSCQECKASFSGISYLNVHMRIHTDERSFLCEICQKSFRQSSHLKTHLKTHDRENPFLCQDCGNTFGTKYNLELHLRVHSGDKPCQCPSCPAAFSRHQGLRSHLNTHTTGNFFCEICQKSFTSSHYFKLHKRMHSGETVLCHVCGKTYRHKYLLQVHLRSCSKEKETRFKCAECNAVFTTPSNLYRHKRIHTGVKPYSCKFCFKVFNQSNNLKAHLLIHLKKLGR